MYTTLNLTKEQPMKRIHILFDSLHGQTMRISHHIGRTIAELGHDVHIVPLERLDEEPDFWRADGFVIGGSVHEGRQSRELVNFVKKNRGTLEENSAAFFSVSLCAGGNEADKEEARGYMNYFFEQTGWQPDHKATFAGALRYRNYTWVTRWFMKIIARKRGYDTDTKQNREYTDWSAVDEFACGVAERVSGEPVSSL